MTNVSNSNDWDGYLIATLHFFLNFPTDSNRTIVFDGMRQYQQAQKQGDIKTPPALKKTNEGVNNLESN